MFGLSKQFGDDQTDGWMSAFDRHDCETRVAHRFEHERLIGAAAN